jgi:hypothetical protein
VVVFEVTPPPSPCVLLAFICGDVATLLGDSKRVAADHYVYALTDYREVDRTIALARTQNR